VTGGEREPASEIEVYMLRGSGHWAWRHTLPVSCVSHFAVYRSMRAAIGGAVAHSRVCGEGPRWNA